MMVALRYTGNDKRELARCDKNGIRLFESIDAHEVLESGNEDYEKVEDHEVPDEHETATKPRSTTGQALSGEVDEIGGKPPVKTKRRR